MDWNFKSLPELHDKFGWEEYLVLALTLLISALLQPGDHVKFVPIDEETFDKLKTSFNGD